ncbi:MAG: DUF3365 domain-containing protein [Pirellulaceae bacterium]
MRWRWKWVMCVLCGLSSGMVTAAEPAADAGVERARKQVRMLDDLYKTAVVLITETYVKSETDVSAGTAAKLLFAAMKQKNWHEARLLDATGNPYDAKNVAEDDFEKQAIKDLTSGKSYVERIETSDGIRYLRAATPVPVVLKKCTLCHPHYADAKPGQAIGALTYRLKID